MGGVAVGAAPSVSVPIGLGAEESRRRTQSGQTHELEEFMSVLIGVLRVGIAYHSGNGITQGSIGINTREEGKTPIARGDPALKLIKFLPSGASKLRGNVAMWSMNGGAAKKNGVQTTTMS